MDGGTKIPLGAGVLVLLARRALMTSKPLSLETWLKVMVGPYPIRINAVLQLVTS